MSALLVAKLFLATTHDILALVLIPVHDMQLMLWVDGMMMMMMMTTCSSPSPGCGTLACLAGHAKPFQWQLCRCFHAYAGWRAYNNIDTNAGACTAADDVLAQAVTPRVRWYW
jgi:hypothetical protein